MNLATEPLYGGACMEEVGAFGNVALHMYLLYNIQPREVRIIEGPQLEVI
jgi:hypothetical protein